MAQLEVVQLKRKFAVNIKGELVTLNDPNPALTPDEVMTHYTGNYPELTTATVERKPKITDTHMLYEFKTTVGTKG